MSSYRVLLYVNLSTSVVVSNAYFIDLKTSNKGVYKFMCKCVNSLKNVSNKLRRNVKSQANANMEWVTFKMGK